MNVFDDSNRIGRIHRLGWFIGLEEEDEGTFAAKREYTPEEKRVYKANKKLHELVEIKKCLKPSKKDPSRSAIEVAIEDEKRQFETHHAEVKKRVRKFAELHNALTRDPRPEFGAEVEPFESAHSAVEALLGEVHGTFTDAGRVETLIQAAKGGPIDAEFLIYISLRQLRDTDRGSHSAEVAEWITSQPFGDLDLSQVIGGRTKATRRMEARVLLDSTAADLAEALGNLGGSDRRMEILERLQQGVAATLQTIGVRPDSTPEEIQTAISARARELQHEIADATTDRDFPLLSDVDQIRFLMPDAVRAGIARYEKFVRTLDQQKPEAQLSFDGVLERQFGEAAG